MKQSHAINLKGKRVLVMGLGLHGGGVGTVKFLRSQGAKVTVTDLRPRSVLAPSLALLSPYRGVRYILGRHKKSDFLRSELVVKNPGVPPTSPYLAFALKKGIPVTSDVGIFFRLSPGRIIGVTGTRGKSTAAYLISKFLLKKFPRVHLAGNIRTSVFEILPAVRAGDWVVLELSSFQLEDLAREKFSPEIAVLTNIMPDHLNWHPSMRSYLKAKSAIFAFQKPYQLLFANPGDGTVRRMVRNAPSRVIFPRSPTKIGKIVEHNLGSHYRPSVILAVAVAKTLGVPSRDIIGVLERFRGLEGRGEEISRIRGVRFVNDTSATIPEAGIAALERFAKESPAGNIILIAGGSDKNLRFQEFARAIRSHVASLILLPGTATVKLRQTLGRVNPPLVREVSSMREAVRAAAEAAKRGDIVLLSPGAASFGLFLNEFDRGAQFNACVERLKRSPHA